MEFLVRGLLDKALLPGQEGVNPEEAVSCVVTTWQGSVNDTLRSFQWTEEAVACIGITLTGRSTKAA